MTDTMIESMLGNSFEGYGDSNIMGDAIKINKNKNVYSLLHYACSCGDLAVFQYVWDRCAKIKGRILFESGNNDTEETPLHFAVSSNNYVIV